MKYAFTILIIFSSFLASGAELKGVKMSDQKNFQETKFTLNSQGIRRVKKFGFDIKVYIAGLYLTAKSSDSVKIIASKEPKWLILEFVRNVDRKPLADGWKKALRKACKACDESMKTLKEFNKKMVNVREGHRFEIGFFPDKVVLNVKARETTSSIFASANFSKDLLSIFLGEANPADKRLRTGLLGLSKK